LENLAGRLKSFREARGLTKYRLAKLCSISQTYIYRIEQGEIKNPRRDTLQALAKGLNVSLAQLIGETSPSEMWELVEQSLKAYIPVYAGIYEVGMIPVDNIVCTQAVTPPDTVRGYRADFLWFSPLIQPNDTIIVDIALTPVNGDIVVVVKDKVASLMRYNQADDKTWLADHKSKCSLEGVIIHGVVTDFVRKLR